MLHVNIYLTSGVSYTCKSVLDKVINTPPTQTLSLCSPTFEIGKAPVKSNSVWRINPHTFDLNCNLFESPDMTEHDDSTNFEELGMNVIYHLYIV